MLTEVVNGRWNEGYTPLSPLDNWPDHTTCMNCFYYLSTGSLGNGAFESDQIPIRFHRLWQFSGIKAKIHATCQLDVQILGIYDLQP